MDIDYDDDDDRPDLVCVVFGCRFSIPPLCFSPAAVEDLSILHNRCNFKYLIFLLFFSVCALVSGKQRCALLYSCNR